MHVLDEKRKKLDDKGEKCVFLSVSEASKANKLFNPLIKKIVTSRDVIFYQENTWDWNRQQPTPVILDEENDEERQQSLQPQIPAAYVLENSQNEALTAVETSPTATESTDSAVESRLHRVQKRPGWMIDYEATRIEQSEDPITHFALCSYYDPTIFEDAVKESKWRNAMDSEIAAIEMNNTWELTGLPK